MLVQRGLNAARGRSALFPYPLLSTSFLSFISLSLVLIYCTLCSSPSLLYAEGKPYKKILVLSYLPKIAESKVLEGIVSEVGKQCSIRKIKVNGNQTKLASIIKAELAKKPRPEAIIALGTRPSRYLCQNRPPIPFVCLGVNQILERELSDEEIAKIRGVDFELSHSTVLNGLSLLVPKAKIIGELKEVPEKTSEQGLVQSTKLEDGNYSLLSYGIRRRREIARTSLKLLRKVDILWLRPSRLLNQPDTVRYLLGKALELGRPVIGLSQNYVRAGALFCLQPDFKDIGAQLAILLDKKSLNRAKGLVPPRKAILCVNARVAQILGLRIPANILNDKDVVVVSK